MKKEKVLIVGASGFVGKNLAKRLLKLGQFEIFGMGRDRAPTGMGINWLKIDLYDAEDIELALRGIDYAIYLVHSMSPTAKLDQGNFQDYDIIMADNFARAAKKSNLKQIIYLGGILPDDGHLSRHLLSRLEVETTLSSSLKPLTTLRAGMIIGQGGSSFSILSRFVQKMKYIPLPPWSKLLTGPIDIENVLDYIEYCLGRVDVFYKSFDIAGDEVISYENLIRRICFIYTLDRLYFRIPKLPNSLSSWLFKKLTHSPEALILPLLESVTHSVVASKERLLEVKYIKKIPLNDSVKKVDRSLKEDPHAFEGAVNKTKAQTVRSVQRLKIPAHTKADMIAFSFLHWLTKYFKFLLIVEKEMQFIHIRFSFMKTPLLTLQHLYMRSEPDRQLFFIKGGLLVEEGAEEGTLEFREILNGQFLLVAIHNYRPSLPWWIYIPTQSFLHHLVIKAFSGWLTHLPYPTLKAT